MAMRRSEVNLILSRKQFVLIIWVLESIISFLDSFSKFDVNCNLKELKDLYDFLSSEYVLKL